MVDQPLLKIEVATAAEVCANYNLSPEAYALLRENAPPGEFLQALLAKKLYVAGIDFLAHALPPREGIWWGCLCMQHVSGGKLTQPEKDAAFAAAQWVLDPTEENREAAKEPAAAGAGTPAGALAQAVNLTGGSVAPPGAAPVPPKPTAPSKAVSLAVKLCSTKAEPARIVETQRIFVELGMGIAEGRYL